MAQRVITLAKEETSQEILTQINEMQTMVDDVKLQTKFGGGRIRKYYQLENTAASNMDATVTMTGKGEVIFFGRQSRFASIDGFETDAILTNNTLITSAVLSFFTELKIQTSLLDNGKIFFYIDWIDEVGTVDYTPKTDITFTES